MQLKLYPKYKDSGIQWIGKIPEGWEVYRLKHILNLKSGDSTKNLKDGEYNIYGANGIIGKCDKYKFYKKNILIGRVGASGSILEARGKYWVSDNALLVILNKNNDYKFIKYKLISLNISDLANKNAQPLITATQIKNVITQIPKGLKEQTAIANFLDKKTVEIDSMIEKDKKLIVLLKEKGTALINHAVTKGLNLNAKFKDSGIPWICEIPEEWEINKIKNTSYVKGRIGWHGLTSEEYSDKGAYLVTGIDFKDGVIEWEDCHHVGWDRYKEDPYIHLKEDDLLITKDGTIGKVALIKSLPDKATLNSGIFLVRPLNKKYFPKFMYWMLNSAVFERFFDYIKTGATISHLYQETFERFFFPIPKKEEQEKIIEYLDKTTSKIDKTIEKIEKKIALLGEYKKSLIHHVVTGKIDVREVEA